MGDTQKISSTGCSKGAKQLRKLRVKANNLSRIITLDLMNTLKIHEPPLVLEIGFCLGLSDLKFDLNESFYQR